MTVARGNDLVIDLAEDTGPFHGGAAGTLYGVYGRGVPTSNLIEGMNLRTVSTKAQDGAQHPGGDALEVVRPLADSTGGDVYVYLTDIHRGFPYQWEGDTPQEKLRIYREKTARQVDQARQLPGQYQDHLVFVPFNEPEGNMFGTGEWSYDGTSWLDDPADYFAAWDGLHRLIRGRMPGARIAGPNTSILHPQVKGFLAHTVEAGTVPDVVTWHELSHPGQVRRSVAAYREWEEELFAGTPYEGTRLPVNINEYAFNYHTSVPGRMIQWIAAIEESKADADIAYWNIGGNLSDSAVQANRGNGQWWLFHAYGSMTGRTARVRPPFPGENYTLQGVATLDEDKRQARALFGGSGGEGCIRFDHVPEGIFGTTVHARVREIPWTGQLGDSGPPGLLAEAGAAVRDGSVEFPFGTGGLPALKESSAYEIVLAPAGGGTRTSVPAPDTEWSGSYEAEDAAHTGSGHRVHGPEGSPSDVSKFHTSGGYHVGGLRTGSDLRLDFTVDVPRDGTYDLCVFAGSPNTHHLVREQGPANVFLRVDGRAEQELHLPLGYKRAVWDHADTTVELTGGAHTLTLAARSLDGERATRGEAFIDRITLSLPAPGAERAAYEAWPAWLGGGARPVYGLPGRPGRPGQSVSSGAGAVELRPGQSATFWVYARADAGSALQAHTLGGDGRAVLAVNGHDVRRVTPDPGGPVAVSLSGGINKVTVTGEEGRLLLDRLTAEQTAQAEDALNPAVYQAQDAERAGTAETAALPLADGGTAVRGIGGAPGNGNTLTFRVTAGKDGLHALRVRYANPEQAEATHYNPDPLVRHADLSVNGGEPQRVTFPHTFHENNFWELTVPVRLVQGGNTLTLRAQELPCFDGGTYASETHPGILLRSRYAPVIDRITLAEFAAPLP